MEREFVEGMLFEDGKLVLRSLDFYAIDVLDPFLASTEEARIVNRYLLESGSPCTPEEYLKRLEKLKRIGEAIELYERFLKSFAGLTQNDVREAMNSEEAKAYKRLIMRFR